MKPNLENLKEYTNKASLSSSEKFEMLQNLRTHTQNNPIKQRYFVFAKHSFVYTSVLALILGSTATSFAAEGSLPGDILYPIKTEINEEVIKAISITKEQKAQTHINLVNERMSELTELVVKKKDTPEKIKTISLKLEEHRVDFEKTMEEYNSTPEENTQEETAIYAKLESTIETHLDILEGIQEKNEVIPLIKSEDTTFNNPQSNSTSSENVNQSTSSLDSNGGEDSAVQEITNFSLKVFSLLTESKLKDANIITTTEYVETEKIMSETRKKIIEETEEDLGLDIEDEIKFPLE